MTESERAKSLRRRYGNRMAEAPRRRGPGGPGRGPGGPRGGGQPKNMRPTIGRLMKYLEQDRLKLALAFVCEAHWD